LIILPKLPTNSLAIQEIKLVKACRQDFKNQAPLPQRSGLLLLAAPSTPMAFIGAPASIPNTGALESILIAVLSTKRSHTLIG
jgi:hypothetical protein